MKADEILKLLEAYKSGTLSSEDAVSALQPYERNVLGRFDQHREQRTGVPEVIYAEHKPADMVLEALRSFKEQGRQLIASRVTPEMLASGDGLYVDVESKVMAVKPPVVDTSRKKVLVISAGTSDRPVATETALMSRLFGNPTDTLDDVGVASLARIGSHLTEVDDVGVAIVVAGMDGALPGVIASLTSVPLIAVPTSVGYGVSFGGVSALMTMLNVCAPGVVVVNIDNGFGAAAAATKILQTNRIQK